MTTANLNIVAETKVPQKKQMDTLEGAKARARLRHCRLKPNGSCLGKYWKKFSLYKMQLSGVVGASFLDVTNIGYDADRSVEIAAKG